MQIVLNKLCLLLDESLKYLGDFQSPTFQREFLIAVMFKSNYILKDRI